MENYKSTLFCHHPLFSIFAKYERAHRYDLPDEPEHDVLPALPQDVAVHVDYVAADGLGAVDGQGEVLVALEEGERLGARGLAVDHAGVDGVGNGEVDQLAAQVKIERSASDIAVLIIE